MDGDALQLDKFGGGERGGPETAPEKLGVIVLGMGRSGTSLVAAAFREAGFYAGADEDVLPAAESNPKGHHENLTIMEENERFLTGLGFAWYRQPPLAVQRAHAARLTPTYRGHVDRLAVEAGGAPIVVKDPRINVLLPLWAPLITAHLHPVLVIRDPIEIALSLEHRDATPLAFGLAIWELHMTAVLAHLNGRTVTVIPYGDLIVDSGAAERLVSAASAHLGPDRARHVHAEAAPAAVDPELRHNRAGDSDHDQLLTQRQGRLWACIGELTAGNHRLDLPGPLLAVSPHVVDSVHAWHISDIARHERSRLRAELAQQQAAAAESDRRLRSEVARYEASERDLARDRAHAVAEAARLGQEAAAYGAELERVRAKYDAVLRSRRWRVTDPPARLIAAARRIRRQG